MRFKTRSIRRRNNLLALSVGAIPLSLCSTSFADKYWVNGSYNRSWSNANDWASSLGGGAGVPGSADNVYLENNSNSFYYTISLNQSDTIAALAIGDTDGGTDELDQFSAYNLSMSYEIVGWSESSSGVHSQSGGTNTYSSGLIVGSSSDSVGTYTLSGTGSIDITGSGSAELGMYLGYFGTRTFGQSGGTVTLGNIHNGELYLGYSTMVVQEPSPRLADRKPF